MPEEELDPAKSTQQFRAFVNQGAGEQASDKGTNVGLIAGIAVIAVVVVVVVALLVF